MVSPLVSLWLSPFCCHYDGVTSGVTMMVVPLACYDGVTRGATMMVLPLLSYGSDTLGVTMMVSLLVSL